MTDPQYPEELQAWLQKYHAKRIGDGVVGDQHHHLYAVNGHLLIVALYTDGGWDIFIPASLARAPFSADFNAIELACRIQSE